MDLKDKLIQDHPQLSEYRIDQIIKESEEKIKKLENGQ